MFLTMGFGDVAATKRKRKPGDAQAQRSLGDMVERKTSLALNPSFAKAMEGGARPIPRGEGESGLAAEKTKRGGRMGLNL